MEGSERAGPAWRRSGRSRPSSWSRPSRSRSSRRSWWRPTTRPAPGD